MPKNDGTGGYWRGGKWVEITWGHKISAAIKSSEVRGLGKERNCESCGAEFKPYLSIQKYCSRGCGYKANYTDKSGVEKKARVVGANLLMGQGKKQWLTETIEEAIGSGCPYCGIELTLDNLTVDHKTGYPNTAMRRNKKDTRELRGHLDRRENLHIVCGRCNQMKGQMSHEQFIALTEFLSSDKWLRDYIEARLMRSTVFSGGVRRGAK